MVAKKNYQLGLDFFPALTKYDMSEVKIEDKGLQRYINIDNKNIYLGGIFANKMFGKSKLPIIERLINNLMRTETFNGKKIKAYKVVREALEIIDKKTKTNPIQVLIDAIQNAAPIEDTTRLQFGGISVPKAVDISPQRRLDMAIRNISLGTVAASHKNKKSIEACLADELMKAAKNDVTSFAVAKRNDKERIAKSAR
jgi:small subunit ribosomal protein S7